MALLSEAAPKQESGTRLHRAPGVSGGPRLPNARVSGWPRLPDAGPSFGGSRFAGANIALYYYGGFCYLMMRRFLDAARAFNTVLVYINRVKQFHARSAQYEQILKKNEQTYALLAITVSLCPAAHKRLDESTTNLLHEK
jgi:RNA polymerase I-associated factor PAF67